MEHQKGGGRHIHHLAFIMDGNRRWAKERKKTVSEGHSEGLRTMEKILLPLFEKGIPFISVYAFSLGNWDRSPGEIEALQRMIKKFRDRNIDEYQSKGIRICVSGRREGLSKETQDLLDNIQEKTRDFQKGTLNICFNYGGRDELVRAAQLFSQDLVAGKKKVEDLTEESFKEYFFSPSIPDVDLLVRTSGEQRLSDFLLYQSAYAEFFFTSTLWPDLTYQEVENILDEFSRRERRFGS